MNRKFWTADDYITDLHERYQLDGQQIRYAWNAQDEAFMDRLLTLVQKAITGPDKDECELGRWLAKQINEHLLREAEKNYWAGVEEAKEARAEMCRDDAA